MDVAVVDGSGVVVVVVDDDDDNNTAVGLHWNVFEEEKYWFCLVCWLGERKRNCCWLFTKSEPKHGSLLIWLRLLFWLLLLLLSFESNKNNEFVLVWLLLLLIFVELGGAFVGFIFIKSFTKIGSFLTNIKLLLLLLLLLLESLIFAEFICWCSLFNPITPFIIFVSLVINKELL